MLNKNKTLVNPSVLFLMASPSRVERLIIAPETIVISISLWGDIGVLGS